MMTKLSDSQRVILSAAAQHERGLARAPKTLPAAARNAVFRSLIKTNLLTEINAPRDHVGLGWPARISGLIAAEISVDPRIAPTKGIDGWNRAQPVQGPTPVDALVNGQKLRRGEYAY